ncbi:dicarboxylate/amino acid:cation (Na or H) symporter (DAACS) family protein, partial [Achlya hypogyna]
MTSTKGIYLYDTDAFTTPTPDRQAYTTPVQERRSSLLSAPSSSSSNGRRFPPSIDHGLRTNFKTTSAASDRSFPATPPVVPLDLHGAPIMEEEDKSTPLHPTYARKTAGLNSSLAILLSALLGVGVGVGLGKLRPSADTLHWIALPGELFVRALKCLIVPLVLCSMTVSIAEVIELKRTSLLTLRTAGIFFLTSCLAACQGMTTALLFDGLVGGAATRATNNTAYRSDIALAFRCANGLFLHAGGNGSVACVDVAASSANQFTVADLHGALKATVAHPTLSLTQQFIAIVEQAVPDNIFSALAEGTLLSIIAFALPLGIAVAKSHNSASGPNHLLLVVRQARNALLMLVTGVLRFTPVAVLFLI